MPIAFPPPALPQAIPVAQVPRGAMAIPYAFGQYRVQLIGFADYDADELERLVKRSHDAEKLVLGLSDLVYRHGDLSARIRYAVAGKQLYVLLIRRPVRALRGSPGITRFFEGTEQSAFDFNRFERARVLASGYADRAGLQVQARFIDAPGDRADLELRATPDPEARHLHVHASAGNQGSRFAGRNLVGGGLSLSGGGVEAVVDVKTAISGEENEQTMGDYLEGTGQISRVSTVGIFGLSARRIDFSLDGPPEIDGWFQEYGVEWSNVLRASPHSRLLGRVRLSYADRQSELASSDEDFFHERYSALELNPSYNWQADGQQFEASAALLLGQAGSQLNSAADDSFQLLRPLLRYTWRYGDHLAISATGATQWTGAAVPEYQQWTLGGIDMMSAFLPATFFGDSGYYLRVGGELGFTPGKHWKTALQVFAERGQVETNGASDATTGGVNDAGVGFSASYQRKLDLRLAAARPIGGDDSIDEQRADYYATVSLRY